MQKELTTRELSYFLCFRQNAVCNICNELLMLEEEVIQIDHEPTVFELSVRCWEFVLEQWGKINLEKLVDFSEETKDCIAESIDANIDWDMVYNEIILNKMMYYAVHKKCNLLKMGHASKLIRKRKNEMKKVCGSGKMKIIFKKVWDMIKKLIRSRTRLTISQRRKLFGKQNLKSK